ncbi:MAG: 1-deoxy-D-xylulose-5-phosphate synthase N-terminal domain-containing protein, partial [Akkermansia sp.]
NLGAVELTVALHRVYDTSKDRLVFDVGHQCYVHKMLTGRNGRMETLRAFGGIAGFPKPSESKHDACIAGHASTAVSTALGMAIARTQLGENYRVVALLGDGSLTGGLAYEGLSMAGQSGEPLVVILNDNGMSINASMGGVAQHLAKQRLKPQYLWAKEIYRKVMHATPPGRALHRAIHRIKEGIKASLLPCSMFENMGFQYMGPVDGHDVKGLTHLLRYASTVEGPVLLHVKTVKGKGFRPAEKNPDDFHGIGPFQKESGALSQGSSGESFSARFGRDLRELARKDPRICAVTAAMTAGTGLTDFAKEFPQRFFDVGIAEEHAVTMTAGMAKQGLIPVFAVYSTFFQRGYDMLI